MQYPSAEYFQGRLVPKRSALTVVLGLTLALIEQRAASPQEPRARRVIHPSNLGLLLRASM